MKEKKLPCYEDDDWMPFGKYGPKSSDVRKLQDVPASYLHWLWQQKPLNDKKLQNYIENSLSALKEETPDLIW